MKKCMKVFLGGFLFLVFLSQSALAEDEKFIKVVCWTGAQKTTTSYTGWIYGKAEPKGEGFVVSGSEIDLFTTKIENPSCRLYYDGLVQEGNGPISVKRFNRSWNAYAVKAAEGYTYMTCAVGSRFTEYTDSTEAFKRLTSGMVDSVGDRELYEGHVSSRECLINGFLPVSP